MKPTARVIKKSTQMKRTMSDRSMRKLPETVPAVFKLCTQCKHNYYLTMEGLPPSICDNCELENIHWDGMNEIVNGHSLGDGHPWK